MSSVPDNNPLPEGLPDPGADTPTPAQPAGAQRDVPTFVAEIAYRVAVRMLKDHHAAQDIAQDACVGVLNAQSQGRALELNASFIARTAYNLVIDRIRRERGRGEKARIHDSLEELVESGHSLPDPARDPESSAISAQQSRFLAECMSELENLDQQILRLSKLSGVTMDAIAPLVGLSVFAARGRFYRGLEALRRCLEKKGITKSSL